MEASIEIQAGAARAMKIFLTDKRKSGQIKGMLFGEGKNSHLDILTLECY